MGTNANDHRAMIALVAQALGDDLLERCAFLGGSATGLLITDDLVRESIRHTEDVDLIVEAVTRGEWARLEQQLRQRGFRDDQRDGIICRKCLGESLIVDFMPIDEQVLGFTNRWYAQALETAEPFQLTPERRIRLVNPAMFVATKLEAYRGRGNGDPLASRDLEDLINLVDGREDLIDRIAAARADATGWIAAEIAALLGNPRFADAVQGNIRDADREDLIFERLKRIAELHAR